MKPVLQALVLAERVYQDLSGKKIIAGTFNQLLIRKVQKSETDMELPDGTNRPIMLGGTDPGGPVAYISLTEVLDGTEITLQLVNVSKNDVLFQTAFKIEVQDRLATVEIVAPLPPMAVFVNEPATFSLDVVWHGDILGSHRLCIKEVEEAR